MISSLMASSAASQASHPEDPAVARSSYLPVDLDALVSHLVAAKRSLSSINHVWRANGIVTAARAALEESVIVSARTGFVHRELGEQLKLLFRVRAEVEGVAVRGSAEFATAIQDLDAVDEQLRHTLEVLRETPVNPAFQSKGEPTKVLHDFVDERAVEEVQSSLKSAIDNVSAAQSELGVSNKAFDDGLHSIQQAWKKYRIASKRQGSMSSSSILSASSTSASRINALSPSTIPEYLYSLESNAQEMADLLESLVRHFDLCVTAVKHTEGGGAAARNITSDLPAEVELGMRAGTESHQAGDDNSGDGGDPSNPAVQLEPLTDSEYDEMVSVIAKDAPEAEDVVLEIQDRIGEMETTLERVLEQRDSLNASYASTTDIYLRLTKFASTNLPDYIAQSQSFSQTWKTEHELMQSGMADLSDLRGMYIGFLDAYDGLILEVARRKSARHAVEKVISDAKAKLDKLYDEDVRAREAFRIDQGDYLPSDIWPGLDTGPMKVGFERIFDKQNEAQHLKGQHEDGEVDPNPNSNDDENKDDDKSDSNAGQSIPNLPRHVVEEAFVRLNARAKQAR